jgi:hypothetical protein
LHISVHEEMQPERNCEMPYTYCHICCRELYGQAFDKTKRVLLSCGHDPKSMEGLDICIHCMADMLLGECVPRPQSTVEISGGRWIAGRRPAGAESGSPEWSKDLF